MSYPSSTAEIAIRAALTGHQVFSTLQLYMGSQYVNDFTFANRTYRVYVQADGQFRDEPRDIEAYYVRNDRGEMIPLENVARVSSDTSAQNISHYNLFRAVEVNGGPAVGFSSGEAMAAMEAVAAETLPSGFSYEWSGASDEQRRSAGDEDICFHNRWNGRRKVNAA